MSKQNTPKLSKYEKATKELASVSGRLIDVMSGLIDLHKKSFENHEASFEMHQRSFLRFQEFRRDFLIVIASILITIYRQEIVMLFKLLAVPWSKLSENWQIGLLQIIAPGLFAIVGFLLGKKIYGH